MRPFDGLNRTLRPRTAASGMPEGVCRGPYRGGVSPTAWWSPPTAPAAGDRDLVPDFVPTSAQLTALRRTRARPRARTCSQTHHIPRTFKTGAVVQPTAR